MSKYAAQLTDNIVEDVIVASETWANKNHPGQWVDCTGESGPSAGIGYTYHPDTKTFTPPEAPIENDGVK